MSELRIAAITGGINVPSRRFRISELVPYLAELEINCTEICPHVSKYPPANRLLRIPWFAAAITERLSFPLRSLGFDAVILQREMISTIASLEPLIPAPRVLDVDDAIYLHRGGRPARRIADLCQLVVCGNGFLAERFSEWNANVCIIPTGVDTNKLRPAPEKSKGNRRVIGWIGTAANYRYLVLIERALRTILKRFGDVRLQIISNEFPDFLRDLGSQLDFRMWKPGIENSLLPRLDIGIMPLEHSDWARGKCSFKMLQYMSAGLPVVATPVGMNSELLSLGEIGFSADSQDQWVDSLFHLLRADSDAERMGLCARELVETHFSLSVISRKWLRALQNLLT